MEEQIYETIIVAAEHAQLKKVHDIFAVEDTVNTLLCQFDFRTEDWNHLEKTAVFIYENGTHCNPNPDAIPIHVLLDETNTCIVPQEVLKDPGYFSVGVFGINGDELMPTNLVRFKCNRGCYSDGTEPSEPTQSIYQQILSALNQKQDKIIPGENVQLDANNVLSFTIPDNSIDKSYVHVQRSSSEIWHIVHDLKKYPSVSIVDSANSLVVGNVDYLNENELVISFTGAFSGKAYLN